MSAASRAAHLAVALALASGVTATTSHAQGFFQSIFGFGGSQSSPAPASRPSPLPPPDFRYRQQPAPPSRPISSDDQPVQRDTGNYRTMCVRMCDGYYFPISASVSRRDFYRDARLCKKTCGTEAVLFYHSSSSGDASTMIDLSGRAYSRLPNALRYRKQLVDSCKCRPEPWAASEIARHHRYAMDAARENAQNLKPVEVTDQPPDVPLTAAKSTSEPQPLNDEATATATRDPSIEAVDENAKPATDAPAKRRQARSSTSPRETAPASRSARATRRDPPASASAADGSVSRPPRVAQKPVQTGFSGLGAGSSKLRWPGD